MDFEDVSLDMVTVAAIAASSALLMVLVIPAPLGSTKLELRELRW